MKARNKKESAIPPETGRSALLHCFLPLMVAIGFSFLFTLMPTHLMAALFYLTFCVGLVIAITHHTKS